MKKIIHMSDLHIGAKLKVGFSEVVDRLIERIRDPSEHVVVITGDLVDKASNPKNYDHAKKQLDRLVEKGFEHILVVPGNHDYYNDDKRADKQYVEKFKRYFFGKEVKYPKVDIIEGVAFIGLDSMAEELGPIDAGGGEGHVGKIQRNALWDLLDSSEIKNCAKRVVYLHHHPIDHVVLLLLKDAAKLMWGLSGRVDAVLYGHHHMGKNFNTPEYQIPRCYDAGCVTLKAGGFLHALPPLKIHDASRIIHLDQDPNRDEWLNLNPDYTP